MLAKELRKLRMNRVRARDLLLSRQGANSTLGVFLQNPENAGLRVNVLPSQPCRENRAVTSRPFYRDRNNGQRDGERRPSCCSELLSDGPLRRTSTCQCGLSATHPTSTLSA